MPRHSDDLLFDPVAHRYTRRGVVVPSVTTVLSAVLGELEGVPADALEAARERGTAVHLATELYDRDDLDIDSLDLVLVPYLEAWIRFRRETGFVPVAIEERVYHPRHNYAGTLDRVGELFGELALVDIKSGAVMPGAYPQTAAYQEAYNKGMARKANTRWIVQLNSEGRYKLHRATNRGDFAIFISALNIFTWQQQHKGA